MPELSGSFSGKVRMQSEVSLSDRPNHHLGLAEISAMQKSQDPAWNNSTITYWGYTDLLDTQGTQQGYFVTTHADGDRDWGTFEAKVSVVAGGQLAADGTWKFSGGSGKLKGISGGGTFKSRMTSPTAVDCSWQGNYQLAGAKAAGR